MLSIGRFLVCLAALGVFVSTVSADTLSTSGFTECGTGAQDVTVTQFHINFDRTTKEIMFAVAGTSKVSQNITAQINVTAYGNQVYTNTFNPCSINVAQLCPIPAGPFHANGNMSIPETYLDQIPAIAFAVPDLDGAATLRLLNNDGDTVSCLTSQISNGKSTDQKSVTYATLGIAGAALAMSGIASLGALGAGSSGGANSGSAHAPNFVDVVQWFQFVAFSGMYSVNYPPLYRNFAKNFAWSTGLVSWSSMQQTIDNFRSKTGGNLTTMSYEVLKNSTLVYSDSDQPSKVQKRALDFGFGDSASSPGLVNSTKSGTAHVVHGIEAFAESLLIPSTNTFMTVLLIFLIVLGAVAVGMLFVKLVLELWRLCGHLGERAEHIRGHYWQIMSSTIVRIVLIVYGTWALYCLYQFRSGDSWAAALLAGVTLSVFTGVIAFFTVRIFYLAAKARKLEGGVDELYEHKPWMRKYGFFYDQFKSKFWWFFVPILVYSLIRAIIIVFGAEHGMVQAIGILATEAIFLFLLFWRRPYDGRGANVINAMISVVRVLSVGCLLIFVEELGIAATTRTVMGVVLLAVQSTLTIILAILIVISAVGSCLHKRKPVKVNRRSNEIDDDLQPLSVPRGGYAAELRPYPTTRGGYMPAATTEASAEGYDHRASTIYKSPYINKDAPNYEEYSSSYRSSQAPSVATRNSIVGHGRVGSIGTESAFQYRPVGSPPLPPAGRRESYSMR